LKGDKMRQILSFIGITALVLVLSACGSAGTTAPATETAVVPVTGSTEVATAMATDTTAMPLETSTSEAMPTAEATSAATAAATSSVGETPTTTTGGGTSTTGGLGIGLSDIKTAMTGTGQFEFSDGDVNGQSASIAKLTSTAAASFPTLAAGFSAAFIGDPANLSEIKITLPRTGDNPALEENVKLVTLLLAGILPGNVQSQFLTWMNQNFTDVEVGSMKETTIDNFKFTLSRTSTDMVLDVVSAK
jgi:hypothetical protein